ncbi:hypothetical protein ACROYT_G012480 [Oculina patagonica]
MVMAQSKTPEQEKLRREESYSCQVRNTMMFRVKFVLALVVLVLAQDAFSKSVKKKHSKKQSIPSQKSLKSHYLLLMGSPIEDQHHRKGLGMILSSKVRMDSDQLKDRPSKGTDHHSNKPDNDLAATLQTSSKGYPSDRGYSYTEALFTGAPLLNGRPFTKSDRTQGKQGAHDNGHPVQELNKSVDSYKSSEADKSNEHTKEEDSVQIQKEVHTQDGVSGFAMGKRPAEPQPFQQFPSSQTGKEEPKNSQNYDEHHYLLPRPSLNASPYKSMSGNLGNKQYTQTHEVAEGLPQNHNNIPAYGAVDNHYQHEKKAIENPTSDHPVEQVHQILVTGKTQENFASNNDGRGALFEKKIVNDKLLHKTYIKSYDEESNLLGSRFYNHGQFVDKHGERVGKQQYHEFNPNVITGPTDYGKTGALQTGESFQKPGMDVSPSEVETSEKESGTVPVGGSSNTLSNGFKANGDISEVGNRNIQLQSKYIPSSTDTESESSKTDASYKQLGDHSLYQNQNLEANVKSANEPTSVNKLVASGDQNTPATYVATKIPIEKTNDSMTVPLESETPNKGDLGAGNYIDQLRPHKIIESSFDEDLVQRIPTGPSYQQNSHAVPIKESTERQGEDVSHTSSDNTFSAAKSEENVSSPPSLPFREGSNPTEFSRQNEQSMEASSLSSEVGRVGSFNSSQNEEATQQETQQQMSPGSAVEARPEHENTFPNDSISQKGREEASQSYVEHGSYTNDRSSADSHEAQNIETLQNSVEHGPDTNDASDNSIKSPGEIPNQREAYKEMNSLPSYREESNPETFGHQNEKLVPNAEQQPVATSSSTAEAAGVVPLSSNQIEVTRQQDTSNKISSTDTVNGANSNQDQHRVESLQSSTEQDTETNSGASDKSNQSEASQETSSSFSYREGSDPKMLSHQNGELAAEQRKQPAESWSPDNSESATVGPSSSNLDRTTQREKSDQMFESNAVETRPDHEDTFIQGAGSHQEGTDRGNIAKQCRKWTSKK